MYVSVFVYFVVVSKVEKFSEKENLYHSVKSPLEWQFVLVNFT